MTKYSLIGFLVFFLSLQGLKSHHTGSSDSPVATTRFVDPFTGQREKPATYLVFTQDYYQSTRENSHQWTTTAYAETNYRGGQFAIHASVPWNYYQQRNREDAARIGKAYVGFKYLPFFDLSKPYFFVVNASVGFPSGPDTDRFTGGDFYAGNLSLTMGYLIGKFSIVTRLGGIRPLSRPQPNNLQDNDGIPWILRLPAGAPPAPNFVYNNMFVGSAYLTYYFRPEFSFFGGFLYRNPYNGVEYSDRRDRENPGFFTETSLGVSWNFSEKYNLNLAYRYPLQRDRDFRLYHSAWTFAFSMELPDADG